MRQHSITALAVVAVGAVGCGSSSSSTSDTLGGNVFGESFAPVEVAFAGPADASCSFPGPPPVAYANSAILIAFSSATGACALATSPCTGHKNLTFVEGTVGHVKLGSQSAPGLQPGTYAVVTDPTAAVPDQNGEVRVAVLMPVHTDAATCGETKGAPASGTMRIDAIGATEVTGFVDVTFGGGGWLKGPFAAAHCDATFMVCEGGRSVCEGPIACE